MNYLAKRINPALEQRCLDYVDDEHVFIETDIGIRSDDSSVHCETKKKMMKSICFL